VSVWPRGNGFAYVNKVPLRQTQLDSHYPRQLYSRRRGYSVQSRLSLFVRTLKEKQLKPSTPNFVHCTIAVTRHAVTQKSKIQRSR